MRTDLQRLIRESSEMRGFHMNDAVLILQWTFGKDELAACDDQPLPFVKVGRYDDVGDAGLVFHRQEDEPHGRPRTLPGDHAARRPYKLTVPAGAQLFGGKNSFPPQLVPAIRHRM